MNFCFQASSYLVSIEYFQYKESLHYIKCDNRNSEAKCHFECLKSHIKRILNCTFNLFYTGDGDNEDVPACTLVHLPLIELIIQNYDYLNVRCKRCLPNCNQVIYKLIFENAYVEHLVHMGFLM